MNRGEALSAPLALPTERIAHLGAAVDCCAAGFQLAYVRFGSGADITQSPGNVRFTPESGHRPTRRECPLCANSDLTRCTKAALFDHLAARPSSGSGHVIPSALAVLTLSTSSTLMDCWTGRSAGLSPLKPNCWVLLRQFARCRGGEAELFGRH